MPVVPGLSNHDCWLHPAGFRVLPVLHPTAYRGIYGQDIYLGADSQDGQFMALLANAIHDCNGQTLSVYNAYSPSTAQGNGLSSVVKINGIRRKSATYSTCDFLCVGQVGGFRHGRRDPATMRATHGRCRTSRSRFRLRSLLRAPARPSGPSRLVRAPSTRQTASGPSRPRNSAGNQRPILPRLHLVSRSKR